MNDPLRELAFAEDVPAVESELTTEHGPTASTFDFSVPAPPQNAARPQNGNAGAPTVVRDPPGRFWLNSLKRLDPFSQSAPPGGGHASPGSRLRAHSIRHEWLGNPPKSKPGKKNYVDSTSRV